ncbi:hypothetical protein SARC_06148 [Sphaeroforma arctica JP610]|uniref:DH domain-containing protein n=1 Tax=Sphaeroforma arctica JP610 TaxID=667725 RepID=A0A0L0FYA3_9EUKA|nr:hypothetical protein SARC_06148 [Sphaeroforma arctica JP610]KNC81541.1 hypothetical protein SARC_06148 [Sphaeroforma arctica JP610]|eukprot:XP_014155443.1 hypothetical protein SARC_06148 [Sphaeroforma arctica JP610]
MSWMSTAVSVAGIVTVVTAHAVLNRLGRVSDLPDCEVLDAYAPPTPVMIEHESQAQQQEKQPHTLDSQLSQTATEEEMMEKTDKDATRRGRIALELLATEKTYTEGLHILLGIYKARIIQSAKGKSYADAVTKGVNIVLGNAHDMLAISDQMQVQLEARLKLWDTQAPKERMLGDIVLSFSPFFKMYTLYARNFDAACEHLDTMTREYVCVRDALKDLEYTPQVNGLPMRSFMITPIQRVPRYKLLFEDYLKHTPEQSPDNPLIQRALTITSEVAMAVNDAVRDRQNVDQLLTAQAKFINSSKLDLIVPGRKWVWEGRVMKMSRKGLQQKSGVGYEVVSEGSSAEVCNVQAFNMGIGFGSSLCAAVY